MKNIILIGYRCTGKSTVGPRLAERLGMTFVDTDDYIMNETGMTIEEIVRRRGWEGFRTLERAAVARLAAAERTVAALGGGAPEDPENRRILQKNVYFVWLCADVATITERMKKDRRNSAVRPALEKGDAAAEAAALLRRREPLYRALNDATVQTDGKSIEEIVDEICRTLSCRKDC